MIVFQYCLFLLLAAAVAKAYAERSKVPFELLLLLGSISISLIPGVPYVSIPSDVILYIFLPPVLFAAAYFTSQRDFYQNVGPILLLAVGLVVATVLTVGYTVHWLVPQVPLSIGFLLGAIVAPPDAAAAAAFAKQLNLPRRVVTILEGESLLNDATALTAFRFALAAVFSSQFSFQAAIGDFAWIAIGGGIIGTAIAWVALRFILLIRNSTAETMVSLVIAFLCYFVAEIFHFSGVIAAVAGGLYFGKELPERVSVATRIEAKSAWNVVLLSLNGIIFTVIGLQLPTMLARVWDNSVEEVVTLILAVFVVLIVTRIVWIFSVTHVTRFLLPARAKREEAPNWKNLSVLSWTGMRGIVTLATVLAVPETFPNGELFPYREQLFVISYAIILLTLVIPSLTLPPMVRAFKFPVDHSASQEHARVRMEMAKAALRLLKDREEEAENGFRDRLRSRYESLVNRLTGNLAEENSFSAICDYSQDERRSVRKLLQAEREVLLALRSQKAMHDEIFHELVEELDFEEIRLGKNVRPLF